LIWKRLRSALRGITSPVVEQFAFVAIKPVVPWYFTASKCSGFTSGIRIAQKDRTYERRY